MYNYVMDIDNILINILKYLDLKELFSISNVNKKFYNIIMGKKSDLFNKNNNKQLVYDTEIYDYIDFVFNETEYFPENKEKILKIIRNNKNLKKLSLILCENLQLAQEILSNVTSKQIKQLFLSLAMFKTNKDLAKFSECLTELAIKNMYFNEVGIHYNILMVENIILLKNLKKLKLNNIKYTGGEFLNLLQCKLEYLDIRECMDFKIQDCAEYLIKDRDHLKTLKLDGENSNGVQLLSVIPNLDNLKELSISYCENLTDDFLDMISIISPRFTKLSLRKLRNITEECFIKFFSQTNFGDLEKLDFYDAPKLNDDAIINISLIKKLKFLDISWCETVSNETLKSIIKSCTLLCKISLQGCKCLDDKLFNDIFFLESEENLKAHLENITFIDLTKCDYVTDQMISSIYEKYPNITIINYYGRDLKDDFYYCLFFLFLLLFLILNIIVYFIIFLVTYYYIFL